MLELHKMGIEVKFFDGRPGQPTADVFSVKFPDAFGASETMAVVARVYSAINKSAEAGSHERLSYNTALSFIDSMQELERSGKEESVPQETASIDLQGTESDVFPSQEVKNGRKKERQLNLLL
jgi:hypothetical protein